MDRKLGLIPMQLTLTKSTSELKKNVGIKYYKRLCLLWALDFFDVYTFMLVGDNVFPKSKPEYSVGVYALFNVLYGVGFVIPLLHWALNGNLKHYVAVEGIYDMVQGGVVGFFWEVNAGILRDGEELEWKLLTLSMVTSGLDALVIKLPSAVLSTKKKD